MFEILKNMFRRKVRTLLTVFGITIGILALVVMGAMAEKLNLLVDGGVRYYQDKVQVAGEGTGLMAVPLNIKKRKDIEKVKGVKYVAPIVSTTLKKELDAVNFGPPASISGSDLNSLKYETYKATILKGRSLEEGDKGKALVGYDLVKKLDAKVGGEITLRGKEFEVVGITDKTFSMPDTTVTIPFPEAQKLVYNDLPEITRMQTKASDIVSGFIVYPKDGVDPNELADTIEEKVKGVTSIGPKQFQEQVANSVKMFSSIIYGIGIISLLVGSLSIINTMTMSVSERTKEIGVKKAVGAKTSTILTEYLTEAGIIGLLGGVLGIGIGSLIVQAINAAMEVSGDKIFLLTPRLLIASLIFSVGLGVFAGIFPAVHATRISIVKSLREE